LWDYGLDKGVNMKIWGVEFTVKEIILGLLGIIPFAVFLYIMVVGISCIGGF
jgi:hypothetical protein